MGERTKEEIDRDFREFNYILKTMDYVTAICDPDGWPEFAG